MSTSAFGRAKAISIEQFKRDARVKVFMGSDVVGVRGVRGDCGEFNSVVRRRMLFAAFNSADWIAFAVLTYPNEFPTDGLTVKNHIDLFKRRLEYQHPGIAWMWGIEFQTRGAVHLNFLFDRFVDKDWLSQTWFDVVGSGDDKHLRAGTKIQFCTSTDEASGYMAARYSAKKDAQKIIPQGFNALGRWWGIKRGLVSPVATKLDLVNSEIVSSVRTLRKVVEKKVHPRTVQPVRGDVKRKRKVKRKPVYFLHSGLKGFTIYRGAKLAEQIISCSSD